MIYIGTAGWSIPRGVAAAFAGPGSHLERFARTLNAVEINSTFYRPHRRSTFARWADSVPDDFRFSVKIPKVITHEQRLADAGPILATFLEQILPLGAKLGGLLVQLPPSLQYDAAVAGEFFSALRVQYDGAVAFEPRHRSWFAPDVAQLLHEQRIARVVADPAVVPDAAVPAGTSDLVYLRLHGSPRVYYSSYDDDALARAAAMLVAGHRRGAAAWCIFDNTASGAAADDALRLRELIAAD